MREQEKVSGTCQGRFWYSGGTAGVVGRGRGHRLPIRRLDLTESKVRELILELQPDFVLFQQLPALVPDVQQYDLIPANTISHSLRNRAGLTEKKRASLIAIFLLILSFPPRISETVDRLIPLSLAKVAWVIPLASIK